MISKSQASLYRWLQVGTPLHEDRGQWQVSPVYSVLNWHQPAPAHGERNLQLCLKKGFGDFDLAFGYEAVARAHKIAGNAEEAKKFIELGRKAAAAIQKAEDQGYVLKELGKIQQKKIIVVDSIGIPMRRNQEVRTRAGGTQPHNQRIEPTARGGHAFCEVLSSLSSLRAKVAPVPSGPSASQTTLRPCSRLIHALCAPKTVEMSHINET